MPYTQKERMCRIVSPLGEDALLVQRLTAHEPISGLFRYDLDLLSENEDLAFAQIVGKSLGVSVRLTDGTERWFHGVVARFEHGAMQGRFVAYRAQVVPWLWLLTRRSACRIYQHMSVPDIARKLFGELGFSDYKFELAGNHPEREYCVQYRETDFAFLSRLFEDEGISYFFEHEEKAHTLVVFDSPDANAPCPSQPTAIYSCGTGAEGAPAGDVRNLLFERELRPAAYALTDFNFEQPSMSLLSGTSSTACVGSNAKLEVYDYPGDFMQPGTGEARVKCRMEEEECASVRVRGTAHCAGFIPGYRFDLRGHYRQACNDAYLLTEVSHFVTESVGDDESGVSTYENQFACIPHSVPYRPPRVTPRPVVHGVQTATVVGAAGKEIDVDSHARVVVQFHWDREGKRNDQSSCRVRVAQNWAGKGWGLIAHPRVGQEVIVEFLEGDPDRPIVTGRVYNGEQVAPYGLPANSTQTGIKSRSSPGGGVGNFNEIRFEDKIGSELVYVQAEKDRSTLTKNDDSQSVGHDRSRSVGNDESVSVENNQTIAVAVNRTRTVGTNESVTVGSSRSKSIGANETVTIGGGYSQSVGGSRTRSVSGSEAVTVVGVRTHSVGINEAITVGAAQEVTVGAARALTVGGAQATSIGAAHVVTVGGSQAVSVGSSQSLTVGGSHSVSVGGSENVSVGGKQSVDVGGDHGLTAGGSSTINSGKKIAIIAADEIVLKAGSATVVLKSSGDISINGKKIDVKGSGNIVMKAKKILQN